MIARVWTGDTPATKSDAYLEYLEATGVRECRATPGNRGVYVLRRIAGGRAGFLFISLWESLEAIRAFAGSDIDKAVYFQEDRDFLLEMDPHVRHYEVAVEETTS
jgi:heme-degrading monooxygenase HmoA